MAPEQYHGDSADRRTDIWPLGVVIYEMVTGQLPFNGELEQAVAAAIQNDEPEPITALRAGVPLELEWIVGKALAKNAGERYQHVEEMIADLRGLEKKLASGKSTPVGSQRAAAPSQAPTPARKPLLAWAALAVIALAALVVSVVYFSSRQPAPEAPVRKFGFTPPLDYGRFNLAGTNPNVVISPNGKHIAFTASDDRSLWTNDIDRGEMRLIPGTEGADDPFWSPGSDFIGYFVGRDIRRVSVQGGAPTAARSSSVIAADFMKSPPAAATPG